jgi:hypothetical protein
VVSRLLTEKYRGCLVYGLYHNLHNLAPVTFCMEATRE